MRLRQLILVTVCGALPAINAGSALSDDTDEGVIRITDQKPTDNPVETVDFAARPIGAQPVYRPTSLYGSMPATMIPTMAGYYGASGCAPGAACGDAGCCAEGCQTGACGSSGCNCRSCGPGGCDPSCPGAGQSWSYGAGYDQRMNCLTAGCSGSSHKCCLSEFWHQQSVGYVARNRNTSWALFGWLVPSGCCGSGCPPTGHYGIVYAKDSNYFDQRDGHLYSAQGYGVPVTVPLSPLVKYQYNYGWGIPSSRITPISNPAGYTTVRPVHW